MTTALRNMAAAAALLTAFAAGGGGLLVLTYSGTHERIAKNQRQTLIGRLNELVPAASYDNDPATDTLTLNEPALAKDRAVTVYRARRHGKPVAVLFTAVAPDGYSGNIELLIAIHADSTLAGVRVVSHKETPGLGDKIDIAHGDWILGFAGKSLVNPTPEKWTVKKNGGDYDQFTGATITPRAVVKAVKRSLEYFEQHREALFEETSSK